MSAQAASSAGVDVERLVEALGKENFKGLRTTDRLQPGNELGSRPNL